MEGEDFIVNKAKKTPKRYPPQEEKWITINPYDYILIEEILGNEIFSYNEISVSVETFEKIEQHHRENKIGRRHFATYHEKIRGYRLRKKTRKDPLSFVSTK